MRSIKALAKSFLPRPILELLRRVRSHWGKPGEHSRHEYLDRYEFIRKAFVALKFNGVTGDYIEFGSHGANTLCIAYRLLSKYSYELGPFHLWAFDSFKGFPGSSLPEDAHPQWIQSTMATPLREFHRLCKSRGVPESAYTVVPGFYEQSLDPSASGPRPDRIRLAYIDCDMCSSTKAVLRFLRPRLQHGMILAFDDYYCWSPTAPSGERLAIAEVFARNPQWRLVPYVQFGWHGMSFVVESIRTGDASGNHDAHW